MYAFFCEHFDCSDAVVAEMWSHGLISAHKREQLTSELRSFRRNDLAYWWLCKASLEHALQFKTILENVGQAHFAKKLEFLENQAEEKG